MVGILSKALGFMGSIIKYGCITHCTFEYLGDFVVCSGPSMEPTLHSNNILFTERISPRLSKISRGDIVIAKCPTNPTQHICKRVIGLPGDKIIATESYTGTLTDEINVRLLEKIKDNKTEAKVIHTYIPKGHVWLEGDNSTNSTDSRYYGPVPKGLIKSRVILRLWPLDQIEILI